MDKCQIEMVCFDNFVLEKHHVGKLKKAINLSFIQYLFGVCPLGQTIKKFEVNAAYCWYIGHGLSEMILRFSAFRTAFESVFNLYLQLL